MNSPVAQKLLNEQRQPQSRPDNQRAIAPPPPGGQDSYRIASNGQDLGTLPVLTIKQMIETGQLTMQDYFFDDEINDWMQLECLADVADASPL